MKVQLLPVIPALVMLGTCVTCCSEEMAISPHLTLGVYESYLKTIRSIACNARTVGVAGDSVNSAPFSKVYRVDFEHQRFWCTTKQDPASGNNLYTESLVTAEKCYEASVDPATDSVKHLSSSLEQPESYWTSRAGFHDLSGPVGYFLDGNRYGHRFLPVMLHGGSLSAQRSGASVLLTSKTDDYELSLKLQPSKGWMAERIDYQRTDSDEDPTRPSQFSYVVEQSALQDGIWFPTVYRYDRAYPAGKQQLPPNMRKVNGGLVVVQEGSKLGSRFIERKARSVISEVTLSEIKMNNVSDADFRLHASIANGVKVTMRDALHLDFVWFNGAPAPSADAMPGLLNDPEFLGGHGSSRFWLLVVNGVLLSALAVIGVRRWLAS